MASLRLLLFDFDNLISAEGATSLQVGLYTRFSYNSLVSLNGHNNRAVFGVSGGWRKTFNLANNSPVSITFDYKVDLAKTYKANLYTEALMSVDGKLLGINGLNSLIHLVSNNKNNTGKTTITSSGKLTATVTTDTLPAGTHTLIIGGYSNKKTSKNDISNITFDNIKLAMPAT